MKAAPLSKKQEKSLCLLIVLLRMLLESRGIPDPDKQIKNREGKLRRILEDWRAKRTAREIEKSAEERSGSGR